MSGLDEFRCFFLKVHTWSIVDTTRQKKKMPNEWRTIESLVHKIQLHGRRGKGMVESFSREKLRQAPQ